MKKRIRYRHYLWGVMGLFASVPASAKVGFGIRVGTNISQVTFDRSIFAQSNRAGFFVGPTLDFTLPVVGLGMDLAVLYDNKGVKFRGEDLQAHSQMQYLTVPVNVKYTIGWPSALSAYGATGLQLAYNIGDKRIFDDGYSLDDTSMSWNVGFGVRFLTHYQIGYNYNIAIGKTGEATAEGVIRGLVSGTFRNNTHQVQFTYFF